MEFNIQVSWGALRACMHALLVASRGCLPFYERMD
jgi:hypothetical protein